jgi:formylglycine-generating enzyme required for sulfatase activity
MNKLKVLVLASLVALVAFTSCQNPINPGQGGTLTVSMNDAVSRSILPGISMNPASYDLTGTGPNGVSFAQAISSGSSATMTGLAFGEWTVTATAKNSDGTAIGQGSGTVTVLSNASVSLAITVRPYDGFGTLNLTVSWPAAQVQTAQIHSTLTPASGSAWDLSFAVNGSAGTASYTASDVATGYHTLILKLLDNGHLAIGAVEVVRIVKDQTTSGTLTFANVNQATGTLEVNLTPEMGDPLEVSISGSAATKPANQSLVLSAAVSNYADNVTYVWYVNGDAKATGASYSFDNTWAQGYYRIDVTAFSADGKRAGSATSTVQVVAAVAGNENYTSANIGTLVYVPAGSFQRDATATNISVITQAYRMSAHEITRAQFLAVMGTDPSDISYSSGTTDPVQMVNWYHAIAFCNKLSIAEGLTPVYDVATVSDWAGLAYASIPTSDNTDWNAATANWEANGYRLPTEMEWMWAAMGATADRSNGYTGTGINTTGYAKAFAGSTGSNAIGDYAWYSVNSGNKTHAAGTKIANELGLYDMSGNVWEWTWDWYATHPTGTQTDYRGAASGTRRVVRGGSWGSSATGCTVAIRGSGSPYSRDFSVGFRVVRP